MQITKRDLMEVVEIIREECHPRASFGIVFYGQYAFSVSVGKYRTWTAFALLPDYFSDSFLLPNSIIDSCISKLPDGIITIIRKRDRFLIRSETDKKVHTIQTIPPTSDYERVGNFIDERHLLNY